MTGAAYPPGRVEQTILKTPLESAYRVIPTRHLRTPLGTARAASRFCTETSGFNVLYAASDFRTALVEVVIRDRWTRRTRRTVTVKDITERERIQISTKGADLTVMDLRGDGCVRLGAPTDAVRARNQAAGQALGQAIHRDHPDIDGILFSSRLTGGDIFAVFERAVGRLAATHIGPLSRHQGLDRILSAYGIQVNYERDGD